MILSSRSTLILAEHDLCPKTGIHFSGSCSVGAATYRGVWVVRLAMRIAAHQWPVLGIEAHGSCGALADPFCNSSIDCRSGERTKAIIPSRGGRLIVTPAFISLSQVA